MGKKTEIAGTAFNWIAKKLWLGLAVVLVLFAVLLSVLRYSLPYLENKKPLFEAYISEQYGVDLTIGRLKADWQQSGPVVVLDNVTLSQSASSPIALDVANIAIEINFWQSLVNAQLSSSEFNLQGLNLVIDSDQLESSEDNRRFPIVDALNDLFLEQLERFSLRDGKVTLLSAARPQVIEISALSWLNRDGQHRGEGAFRMQELTSNAASFIINLTGGRENLQGTLYARAEDLDISPWVSGKLQTRRPLQESRANLEVWAEVKNSAISGVFTQLHESRLTWGGEDNVRVSTGIHGGSFQALPRQQDWFFRIDQLEVVSNGQSLVTDMVGQWSPGDKLIMNTVKPTPVNPFLLLLPLFTSDTADDDVRGFKPAGQLATLQVKSDFENLAVAAKLLDVSWREHNDLPGVDALDIDVFWSHNQGALSLHAKDAELETQSLLSRNISLTEMRGDIYIYPKSHHEQNQWMVSYDNLLIQTPEVTLTQSLRLNVSQPHLSLFTHAGDVPVSVAKQLLPASLMGQSTADYLQRALTGNGQLTNTRVLWHGKPANFPFTNNTGIFQAYTQLKSADFAFADTWPALRNADMALKFENDGLHMQATQAMLADIDVSDVDATIMPLTDSATLKIDATGSGTGQELAALMAQSALADSLGKVLGEEVKIDGPVTAQLHLAIPLNSPDVLARGTASLSGNQVTIARVGMALKNVSGDITFLNENIRTSDMQGSLLGQPLTLAFSSGNNDDGYSVDIGAQGNWSLDSLTDQVSPSLRTYLSGTSDWQANVSLLLPEDGFSYNANIYSTMQGVTSNLPAPFAKPDGTIKRLAITSVGDEKASTIKAMLGDDIAFDGVLPHQEMQFSRAHLALGSSEFSGRGIGFSISADLPYIDLGNWYTVVDELIGQPDQQEEQSNSLLAVPQRLFISTPKLNVAGQTLNNVDIVAKQNNHNWLMDVDSTEARASIHIYEDFLNRGVRVEADYINLPQWSSAAESSLPALDKWKAASLPPVYARCKTCTLLGNNLGEVILDVVRGEQGMIIRQLSAANRYTQLKASGRWDTQSQTTSLNGTLNSDDVGRMLQELNINSGIKDSAAAINFALNWPDSPMDFSVAQLNGNIDWRLTDGYLSDLSDQGSRIFTLFSLNSLVRKLSLDFRDVFAQGFFYDDMSGTLKVTQGKASTNDTIIDGGAGEITINGVTNLVAQKLNYDVSFTPNVTGNLPVLVYFLASPPTALAALAIDQVLTSAKVISNVNYKVTGTWDNPEFTEMGRDSKEVTLPAPTKDQEAPDPSSQPDLKN